VLDVIVIAVLFLTFALLAGYVVFCERVIASDQQQETQ
jgi:hypothetical protein